MRLRREAFVGLWWASSGLHRNPQRSATPNVAQPEVAAPDVPLGDGWVDLSAGEGRCWRRIISLSAESQKAAQATDAGADTNTDGLTPPLGAVCAVAWTAWLGDRRADGLYERGPRMGNLQPNSTLDFTLGGGRCEATRSWDLAVAKMRRGDRVEVFASPEYAFGTEAAEPHLPADSRIFFHLHLLDWDDWADGRDVIYGLDKADDDDFGEYASSDVLRDSLERAAEVYTERDAPVPEDVLSAPSPPKSPRDVVVDVTPTAEEDDDATSSSPPPEKKKQARSSSSSIIEDLGGLDARDVGSGEDPNPRVPDPEPDRRPRFADARTLPPVDVDGKGRGYSWSENAGEMFLRVDVEGAETEVSAKDIEVEFGAASLAVRFRGETLVAGDLEGPIYPDDCTWAVADDGAAVDVFLAKRRRPVFSEDLSLRGGAPASPEGDDDDDDDAPKAPKIRHGPSLADIWSTVFAKATPQSPLPMN